VPSKRRGTPEVGFAADLAWLAGQFACQRSYYTNRPLYGSVSGLSYLVFASANPKRAPNLRYYTNSHITSVTNIITILIVTSVTDTINVLHAFIVLLLLVLLSVNEPG
jgi:hypothetical protein